MRDADVLLHAAVSEGFCNAVMEAQAMELPVVCTDAGGLPENVADGESGFVVPRRDPAALSAKLEELARDFELRRRMGKAGRRRVLEKFQLSDQLDRFERLYEQVLEGARPSARPAERVEEPMTAVGGGTGS
jgi:colanic acid/amylovoran biosynthesis glycosyltransferase